MFEVDFAVSRKRPASPRFRPWCGSRRSVWNQEFEVGHSGTGLREHGWTSVKMDLTTSSLLDDRAFAPTRLPAVNGAADGGGNQFRGKRVLGGVLANPERIIRRTTATKADSKCFSTAGVRDTQSPASGQIIAHCQRDAHQRGRQWPSNMTPRLFSSSWNRDDTSLRARRIYPGSGRRTWPG